MPTYRLPFTSYFANILVGQIPLLQPLQFREKTDKK